MRGAEQGIACIRAEAAAVDQGLWVFDTETDGKRFRLDLYATPVQHVERVACTVTRSQHDMIGKDRFAV